MQRGLNLYNTNSFRNLRSGVSLGMQGITSGTVSIVGDNTITLLIERVFPPATGSVSVTGAVDNNLVTEINMLATDAILSVTGTPALTLSITEGLKEPSVKDITSQLIIIDSTDIFEETVVDTEVI